MIIKLQDGMGRPVPLTTKAITRALLNTDLVQDVVEKAFLKREQVGFTGKRSEYGRRLLEKQKVMHYYGMRERQMRKRGPCRTSLKPYSLMTIDR